jgi:hypothetical protein
MALINLGVEISQASIEAQMILFAGLTAGIYELLKRAKGYVQPKVVTFFRGV